MGIRELVGSAVLTLVIGGTVYTVNQADVVDNFASDTGLTQEQAKEYVEGVGEDDLVPYEDLGGYYIDDGEYLVRGAQGIDCLNYEYEWESTFLSCPTGKYQLERIGNDEIELGQAYIKLGSDSASKEDISRTISLLDRVNQNLNLEIIKQYLDYATITEEKRVNSYNKATLQAVLDSY